MDLSLAGPVLYAGIAFGVSVSAVIFGYLYTKGRGTAVDTKVGEPTKSDVKNTTNSEVKSTSKPTSNIKPSYGIVENKSPVSTGAWPLEDGEGDAAKTGQERDPVEYCSHLQSEVKKTKQKVAIDKIEEKMSADQKEEERRIQSEQLSAIFNLMSNQQDKFGVDTMDEMQSQMKLYM